MPRERPVSLLVAAYNAGATIDATLASIAAGTDRPAQVIVIDDGSTDDTATRAASWADRLPLTLIESPANEGLSAARNRGLLAAEAPVVGILDADDVALPDHVRLMFDAYEAQPGIISPSAYYWLPDGRTHAYRKLGRRTQPPRGAQLEALIRANFVFVASFAPTQALVDIGGFRGFVSRNDAAPQPGDRGLAEDWDMWLRLAALGVPISIVEAPTLLYRVRDSSLASDEGSLLDAGIAMLCAFDAEQSGRHHHAVRAAIRTMEQRRQLAHLQRELRRSGHRAAPKDVLPLMSRDWRTSLRALGLTVLTPERAERVLGRRGAW